VGEVVVRGFANFYFFLNMPHQLMSIACKKCGTLYCPVCKERCPECRTIDVADEKIMEVRKQMKAHMNRKSVEKQVDA
jgi:uncharacterized OB-fold protein